MKNQKTFASTAAILRLLIALAIACALSMQAAAQTPGGTSISNQASASYSDGKTNPNTSIAVGICSGLLKFSLTIHGAAMMPQL